MFQLKRYTLSKLGIIIILIAIGMFSFGGSMFTYQGPPLTSFVSKAGEYSFFYWLPTMGLGVVLLIIDKTKKSKQNH
jgi:uncharacterized membrane protein YkgB